MKFSLGMPSLEWQNWSFAITNNSIYYFSRKKNNSKWMSRSFRKMNKYNLAELINFRCYQLVQLCLIDDYLTRKTTSSWLNWTFSIHKWILFCWIVVSLRTIELNNQYRLAYIRFLLKCVFLWRKTIQLRWIKGLGI